MWEALCLCAVPSVCSRADTSLTTPNNNLFPINNLYPFWCDLAGFSTVHRIAMQFQCLMAVKFHCANRTSTRLRCIRPVSVLVGIARFVILVYPYLSDEEHFGRLARMSVSECRVRRFERRQQYVVSLSKTLCPHCFSRLSCEMSTRW